MTLTQMFEHALAKEEAAEQKIFETKPRFKNAPPICIQSNLLSFEDEAALHAWRKQQFGEAPDRITKMWLCPVCSGWHHLTKPRSPSGESSGSNKR